MSNIAITNYCNLQCPYCFANRMITEEEKQNITKEQLDRILEFLSRTTQGRVGIIGGEPTIHPEFPSIVDTVAKFCTYYHTHCTIFTNGILLKEHARLIDGNVGCLINVNHPDVLGSSNWDALIGGLNRIQACSNLHLVSLGVNLYSTLRDYDFIFELARYYRKDRIRVSYVAPTCQFSGIDKEEYYSAAKDIFLPFVEKATEDNISLKLDCNHIPRCFFDEDELSKIDRIVEGFHDYCEPVIDITPDFKATACFGAYELFELEKFDNIQQVERYLRYKKLYPLAQQNSSGKCAECSRYNNLSCQGGCLAFANK